MIAALFRRSGPQAGLALGAVTVLGVGVGMAATVFALADPYVGRPLPFADPDHLVSISLGLGRRSTVEANQADVPDLSAWQARTDLFEGLAAFSDAGWMRVRLSDRIVPLRAVAGTDSLLEVLGYAPRASFEATTAWVSTRASATLSGGALAPGRSVPVPPSGILRVGGILPPSFLLPEPNRIEPVDVLVHLPEGPIVTIDRSRGVTMTRALTLVGRMRPGITPQMIEAALDPAIQQVGHSVSVRPLSTAMRARGDRLGRGAWLASALLIVVCWMNVFGLALTRGLYRERELATRAALGAAPRHLVRLLMGEGMRIAFLGTALAWLVTATALTVSVGTLPAEFTSLGVPTMSLRVVLLVALCGTAAWGAWCTGSLLAWRFGPRHHAHRIAGRDGRAIRAMRFVLTAGQVAAAGVLLSGAAFLGRTYLNLIFQDTGMDWEAQTLSVAHDADLPPVVLGERVAHTAAALRQLPGVQAVGVTSGEILNGRRDAQALLIDGKVANLEWRRVDRGFFEAAGLQFLAGGPPDIGRGGAVITERMARAYFDGRPAIGQVLVPGRSVPIVGIVRDVRSMGLARDVKPVVYEVGDVWPTAQVTYVLRAGPSWQSADGPRLIRELDPMAVMLSTGTIAERFGGLIRDRTFAALVVALFAVASLLVTGLGVTGIVAYTVVKRTREIAVRLALGATGASMTWLAVRDAVTAAAVGVLGGGLASVWLSRALESLLYGLQPADPSTLLIVAGSLLALVTSAAMVPGIRTSRIAPAAALRSE